MLSISLIGKSATGGAIPLVARGRQIFPRTNRCVRTYAREINPVYSVAFLGVASACATHIASLIVGTYTTVFHTAPLSTRMLRKALRSNTNREYLVLH